MTDPISFCGARTYKDTNNESLIGVLKRKLGQQGCSNHKQKLMKNALYTEITLRKFVFVFDDGKRPFIC